MNTAQINRQWLLARRPEGALGPDDFNYNEGPVPTPAEGDILVRSVYFGYDASQRIWLTDDGGYLPPVQVDEPIRTMGIGQVVESRDPGYAVGDLVEGFMSCRAITHQRRTLWATDSPARLR
jgi:NADPH-dependent curcumin reductase